MLGTTIVEIRPMTKAELKKEGWEMRSTHQTVVVIVLSDGSLLYPSRDEEGNGPGVFFTKNRTTTSLLSFHKK